MINLIVGHKGSGKTKLLIDMVNKVQKDTIGVVPPSFSSDKKLPDINETAIQEQPNTMIMVVPPGKRNNLK